MSEKYEPRASAPAPAGTDTSPDAPLAAAQVPATIPASVENCASVPASAAGSGSVNGSAYVAAPATSADEGGAATRCRGAAALLLMDRLPGLAFRADGCPSHLLAEPAVPGPPDPETSWDSDFDAATRTDPKALVWDRALATVWNASEATTWKHQGNRGNSGTMMRSEAGKWPRNESESEAATRSDSHHPMAKGSEATARNASAEATTRRIWVGGRGSQQCSCCADSSATGCCVGLLWRSKEVSLFAEGGRWGVGSVPVGPFGLGGFHWDLGADGAAAWREHAELVDRWARAALPPIAAAVWAVLLCFGWPFS